MKKAKNLLFACMLLSLVGVFSSSAKADGINLNTINVQFVGNVDPAFKVMSGIIQRSSFGYFDIAWLMTGTKDGEYPLSFRINNGDVITIHVVVEKGIATCLDAPPFSINNGPVNVTKRTWDFSLTDPPRPIPEPLTLLTLGGGLAGLSLLGRSRKKAKA